MKRLALMIIALIGLSGCYVRGPMLMSSTSAGPKEIPVTIATGESSSWSVLGMIPDSDSSLEAAITDAKKKAGGDTMINVFADRETTYFLFVTHYVTRVYGTVVRYEKLETSAEKK